MNRPSGPINKFDKRCSTIAPLGRSARYSVLVESGPLGRLQELQKDTRRTSTGSKRSSTDSVRDSLTSFERIPSEGWDGDGDDDDNDSRASMSSKRSSVPSRLDSNRRCSNGDRNSAGKVEVEPRRRSDISRRPSLFEHRCAALDDLESGYLLAIGGPEALKSLGGEICAALPTAVAPITSLPKTSPRGSISNARLPNSARRFTATLGAGGTTYRDQRFLYNARSNTSILWGEAAQRIRETAVLGKSAQKLLSENFRWEAELAEEMKHEIAPDNTIHESDGEFEDSSDEENGKSSQRRTVRDLYSASQRATVRENCQTLGKWYEMARKACEFVCTSGGRSYMDVKQMAMSLPIFSERNEDFIERILSSVTWKHFKTREVVLSPEHQQVSSMFLVIDGVVCILIDDIEVDRFAPGQYFGENFLLGIDDIPCMQVIAGKNSILVEFERHAFVYILEKYPEERAIYSSIIKRNKTAEMLKAGTLTRPCKFFKELRDETLKAIDQCLFRRIYFPGQLIIQEGEYGDELYILVRGRVEIQIAGRCVREEDREGDERPIEDSLCFGELGLLGVQECRTATIMVTSPSHVRVLYRKAFQHVLAEFNDHISGMQDFMQRYDSETWKRPAHTLAETSIFQQAGCSEEFLDFLSTHLEDRVYLKGQIIVDANYPSDNSMILVTKGRVLVRVPGEEVRELEDGSVFGEVSILGLASDRATLEAIETTWLQILHQNVVVRGLELFPDERRKVLLTAYKHSGNSVGGMNDFEAMSDDAPTYTALQQLKNSPLYCVSPAFLKELGDISVDRIYLPGDSIIQEGNRGDTMFVMISGSAGVLVNANQDSLNAQLAKEEDDKSKGVRVGTLTSGGVTGELAMLGVSQIRSATIQADTICSMWEITQDKGLPIIQKYEEAQAHFKRLCIEHLDRTVPSRLLQLPLFRYFDRKFRVLLGLYAERHVHFPGNLIAKEGTTGDKMFVVNLGAAMLEKKGVTLKTYALGTHFGCTVMLNKHKYYFGDLVALQTCHILSITRASYLYSLDQYPSQTAAKRLKTTEYQIEEELRQALQRSIARKLIWRKHNGVTHLDIGLTATQMLAHCLIEWGKYAKKRAVQRERIERETLQKDEHIQEWLEKRRRQIERAKQLREDDGRTRSSPRCAHPAEKLGRLVERWPAPLKPAHYTLRVWDVLTDAVDTPSMAHTLLPILASQEPSSGKMQYENDHRDVSSTLSSTGNNSRVPTRLSSRCKKSPTPSCPSRGSPTKTSRAIANFAEGEVKMSTTPSKMQPIKDYHDEQDDSWNSFFSTSRDLIQKCRTAAGHTHYYALLIQDYADEEKKAEESPPSPTFSRRST